MKKRYFALFLAALITLALFPAGALAAEFSSDDFNRNLTRCNDDNCAVIGCMGPKDPKHGTKQFDGIVIIPLNLSSVGKRRTLDIPAKSGMTLNDIPYQPDTGTKGHILIGTKELLAAMSAQTLLKTHPNLTPDNLLIAKQRLYLTEDGIAKLSDLGNGDYFMGEQYWNDIIGKRESEKFGLFQLKANHPLLKKSPFDLEGEAFELAINGKPIGSATVNNIYPDKQVPFFDPDYGNDPGPSEPTLGNCPRCSGDGTSDDDNTSTCGACKGTGRIS